HIRMLYDAFKDEAQKEGTPNEYALYSIIRLYAQQQLELSQFPHVLPYGEEQMENHDRVLNFIQEKGKPVSRKELDEEFITKRGWKEFTLSVSLAQSEKIIRYEQSVYTLASRYEKIKQESFQPIIAKLESELSESSLLYIPSFYEGNKIFL